MQENAKKKAKTANSPKAVKEPKGVKSGGKIDEMPTNSLKQSLWSPSINGPKLKEDLGVLVGYVMNLKNSLHQANSGGETAEKSSATLLHLS